MRVLGPNCQGLVNLQEDMAASFSRSLDICPLREGTVAYLGQSGAIGGSVLDLAQERGLGFSIWASTGNQADLDVLDLAEVLLEESPGTQVFAAYLETLPDGTRYRALARRIRRAGKHLIVLQSGRSEAGRRAVASHTGAMLSPGVAFELASAREGVILVEDVDELLDVSFTLSANPPPEGRRVGIVTSSGGAGILAADRCEAHGLEVPELPAEIQERLSTLIPSFGAFANPVDVTAQLFNEMDAGQPALFREVCLAVGEAVDILVITLTMLTGEMARQLGEDIVAVSRSLRKPVLTAWLVGEKLGEPGRAVLAEAGVPVFSSPGAAVRAVAKLIQDKKRTDMVGQDNTSEPVDLTPWLSEPVILEGEAMELLKALDIPYPPGRIVSSAAEAGSVAKELGTHLVLKIQSPDLSHKTDVGGVRLGIAPEDAPRVYEEIISHVSSVAPYTTIRGVLIQSMVPPGGQELILGVTQDPTFGPLLTLGFGGVRAEIYRDVASEILPISPEAARDLLESLAGAPLLKGYRGWPPADIEALVKVVCRVADAVGAAGGDVEEFEINPLIVYPEGQGVLAVDLLVRTTGLKEPTE